MTRSDGRGADELRPIRFTRGWLDQAGVLAWSSSAVPECCVASLTQGVPRWRKDSGLGWVTGSTRCCRGPPRPRIPGSR